MATIVISYRREDSKWIADRIFDRFESHYGKGNVFMDIDSIPFGLDFRDHIRETLDRCDVMVALVGPNWIGRTRTGDHILNETDWVRIEVEAALKKKIPLIPLLIDGSQMPKSDELPDSLKNFVFRQAAAIERENFHAQMDKVIASIDQHLSKLERNKLVEHTARQPVHSKIPKAQVPIREKFPSPSPSPVPAQEQAKKSAQPQINNVEKPKASVRGHNSNLLVGSIVLGVAVILMAILALVGSGPH